MPGREATGIDHGVRQRVDRDTDTSAGAFGAYSQFGSPILDAWQLSSDAPVSRPRQHPC